MSSYNEQNLNADLNAKALNAKSKDVAYSSRLKHALHRFTGNLATPVRHPMREKYGEAYDYLVNGDAHRYREEIDTAMDSYRKALELDDNFTEAAIGMGKCLRRKGDAMGAINYFKHAASQNQFNKEVYLDLAKCYTECGYLDKATRNYELAIKLDPEYIDAMFGLALVLEINNTTDRAMGLYQDIIDIDADFLPAYNNLGSLYMRLGMYKNSEHLFRQLIEKAPDFSRGYLGLAITLDKAGQKQEALTLYHQVLAMRPQSRSGDFIKKRIHQIGREINKGRRANRDSVLVRIK